MKNYQNISDEQLIERLRAGEEDIMDYILKKYKPLVRSRANTLYLIGGDTDDLMQEGMIGLFKAIRDYRVGQESSFFSFAGLCIMRQLYSAIEASNRKKHTPLNTYISFEAGTGEDGVPLSETLVSDEFGNPEYRFIEQEEMEAFFKSVYGRLSPMEKKVLDRYLEGLNYRQIADDMGKSPKVIDNALTRIRNKIRMGEEGSIWNSRRQKS